MILPVFSNHEADPTPSSSQRSSLLDSLQNIVKSEAGPVDERSSFLWSGQIFTWVAVWKGHSELELSLDLSQRVLGDRLLVLYRVLLFSITCQGQTGWISCSDYLAMDILVFMEFLQFHNPRIPAQDFLLCL